MEHHLAYRLQRFSIPQRQLTCLPRGSLVQLPIIHNLDTRQWAEVHLLGHMVTAALRMLIRSKDSPQTQEPMVKCPQEVPLLGLSATRLPAIQAMVLDQTVIVQLANCSDVISDVAEATESTAKKLML